MRVLQAIAGAGHGGAEAFFVRLTLALHRAGIEQRVVIRRNQQRATVLRAGGLAPVELAFGGRLDLGTRWGLRREIKAFKPDIVLTWMNRATSFCPRGKFAHVGRLGGYYDLKYYRRCDHLVGNTEDIRSYLQNAGWAAERVHYLPNFVNGELTPPASRSDLFTPASAPLVLALGRLHENKGFDTLIKAMQYAPDAYLWIAGDGPLRGPLEDQAERLGVKPRTRFLGWRDDVPALLAAADLFVCASRHEPLGNVVLEAWAQGRPVIATDAAGPASLIDHMESGILVPIDDSSTMGQAIRYVLSDAAVGDRLAGNGHAVYQARFTESQVIQQYVDFFEKIVS